MKRSSRKLSRKRDIPEKNVGRGLSPSEREEIKQMKEGKKEANKEDGEAKTPIEKMGKQKIVTGIEERKLGEGQQMASKSK